MHFYYSSLRNKVDLVKWKNNEEEEEKAVAVKDVSTTDRKNSVKHLVWITLYISCIFAMIMMGSLVTLFWLSANSGPECGGGGGGAHFFRPTEYYPSSPWSKVIDMLKPFCRIEYHGPPPV